MTDALPPMLGLVAFESSARHLSFAAAAAELHLSASAISQRVRVLESHLEQALFERRPRSLRLTTAGEAYLPAVRDIFEDLSAATAGVFGEKGRATLTVRAQVSYATTWLAPRLSRFTAQHPHVDVHLISSIWVDGIGADHADLEIRQGTGSWDGFDATRLHEDRAVAVRRAGGHRDASGAFDGPRVQVLGFDDVWRRFTAHLPDGLPEPESVVTVDTSVAALQIVATSDLWTIVPERFAHQGIDAGQLRRLPVPAIPMRQSHYLLRPRNRNRPTSASLAFERWLREEDRPDEVGESSGR